MNNKDADQPVTRGTLLVCTFVVRMQENQVLSGQGPIVISRTVSQLSLSFLLFEL